MALVSGALAGCAGLLPGGDTASTLYGLKAPTNVSVSSLNPQWQLIVEEPLAERALDTDRIAVYSGPHALQYFTGARWTDRAPRMVQDLIVETFEHAGLHMSATRQSVAVRPNVALISDLRDFEAQINATGADGEGGAIVPEVVVRISAKIVWLDGRTILDGRTFEARGMAASDKVSDVVRAMNQAAQGVVHDIVVWSAAASDAAIPAQ